MSRCRVTSNVSTSSTAPVAEHVEDDPTPAEKPEKAPAPAEKKGATK